jgi:tetratricopeptide (TPR) repeat protein
VDASETKFKHCAHLAQDAYQQGSYRKAEKEWEQALGAIHESKATDDELAWALRHLGETFMKMGRYAHAQVCFDHTQILLDILGRSDSELQDDEDVLSRSYTPIDTSEFSTFEEQLMLDAKVEHSGILETPQGKRVRIKLEQPYFRATDHPGIPRPPVRVISAGRNVSFELCEKPGNVIEIKNIEGIRVKGDHWRNLTGIIIDPPSGEHNFVRLWLTAQDVGNEASTTVEADEKLYSAASKIAAQLRPDAASSRAHHKVPHAVYKTGAPRWQPPC